MYMRIMSSRAGNVSACLGVRSRFLCAITKTLRVEVTDMDIHIEVNVCIAICCAIAVGFIVRFLAKMKP